MIISKKIGNKLKQLQNEYSYSQQQIGNIIGVTRQTMAKYLNGEQILDSDKLYILSKHFNKPLEYFLSDDFQNDNVGFMFRADNPASNFNKELRDYLTKKFNNYYDVIKLSNQKIKEYLPPEYRINITGKQLSAEDKDIIEEIAYKQRKYFSIDNAINVDVFRLLERNNINIISEPLDSLSLDALSAFSNTKGAFIFINDQKNLPEERKIFSLIHELGHLIMHREDYSLDMENLEYSNDRIRDIREKAADFFASCFLIPKNILKKNYLHFIKGYITIDSIIELKEEFGVSAKSLIYTIYMYSLIDSNTMGKLFSILKDKGFENTEPYPKPYIKKNEKYYNLIKSLVIEDKLSVNKVAELLNINILEARNRVKEWKNI